jgi:hypothetical protein
MAMVESCLILHSRSSHIWRDRYQNTWHLRPLDGHLVRGALDMTFANKQVLQVNQKSALGLEKSSPGFCM